MGCCGSVDKDAAERLQTVEKEIQALGLRADEESLSEAQRLSKELRELFEVFASSADMRMIEKVQDLSDLIVRNLMARVDLELLKKPPAEHKPVIERLRAVCLDLDAVRATKASKLLDSQVSSYLEQLQQQQEKAVDPIMKKICLMREKLQQAGQEKNLVPGSKNVLEAAEQAFQAAPEAKSVARSLLEQLVPHALLLLSSEARWIDAQCGEIIELGRRVDRLAERLVALLEASWEPAITPQVERLVELKAVKAKERLVHTATQCLEQDKGGEAYHCLVELRTWWPWLHSHSLEVVGLFSKMQSYAQEAFMQAARAGDKAGAEEIRAFAVQFDDLRTQFEGLPAPAARALGEELETGEAKIQVSKALETVAQELAKTTDDDASTNLSLAATIEALEALKVAWPVAKDEELSGRVQKTCDALEHFALEAMKTCSVEQIGPLIQFAQEYDVRRVLERAALRPLLATKAALKQLLRAETELAKSEGMRPHVLLDSLRAVAALSAVSEEVLAQLRSVLLATDERLLKSFAETLKGEAENEKKELYLEKFAEGADEVRVQLGLGGASLLAEMQRQRQETAMELTAAVTEQITSNQLGSLKDLAALCRMARRLPDAAPSQALAQRFLAALASAAPAQAREALAQPAHLATLQAAGLEVKEIKQQLLERVVRSELERARELDLMELSEHLETLERFRKDETLPSELLQEIAGFCGSLEEPCVRKMLEVGRAKGAALLDLAVIADRLRSEAMLPRLTQAQKVVGLCEEAESELSKASGMNPKAVVGVLGALGPLLPAVGADGLGPRLAEVLRRFEEKLLEASGRALAGDDVEAKLEAVRRLAAAADAAQASWPKEMPRRRLEERLQARQTLLTVEKELSKESGMNPKLLLEKFQALEASGAVKDLEDAELQRYEAACSQVGQRMKDSLREAASAGHAAKQKALLQFAKEFDEASGGSLEAELQAVLDGAV